MLDYAKLTQKFSRDITVSVNIEPTYLMDARFLLDVEHLLQNIILREVNSLLRLRKVLL